MNTSRRPALRTPDFNAYSRIPQLYFGSSSRARSMTPAEKQADQVYMIIRIVSEFLFLVLAAIGYFTYNLWGLLAFGLVGYSLGIWLRRSLGVRGRKHTTGFFKRMRERAEGSAPGLLEAILERMAGKEWTPAMCRAVAQTYEKHVLKLRGAKSLEEQNQVLADLDQQVWRILGRKA